MITPFQTIGPFFPEALSYRTAPGANGTRGVIVVEGTVRDGAGAPVGDALVEVWQADAAGRCQAPFGAFARVPTGPDGGFTIETTMPGSVAGPNGGNQAPHLVVGLLCRGILTRLLTRIYFEGESANEQDPVLQCVPAPRRHTLLARRLGEGRYRFDLALQGDGETVFFDVLMAVRLHYDVHGPEDAPVLLLSNSLGTSLELWDPQLPVWQRSFRVVRYDTRGHGRSHVPPAPYTLDELGRDALAVLDEVGARRAHVCGISIGGLTALWLGLNAPERVGRLVAANTAARVGTADLWNERIRRARDEGLARLAEEAMARWFTAGFRDRHPGVVDGLRRQLAACPLEGYAGCCAALRDADLTDAVSGITAPVLIVTGTQDPATTPAAGERLRDGLPGAKLVALDCAHLSNVEAADAFTAAVGNFLSE